VIGQEIISTEITFDTETLLKGIDKLIGHVRPLKATEHYADSFLITFLHQELARASHELRFTLDALEPAEKTKRWVDLISIGFGIFNTYQGFSNRAHIQSNAKAIESLTVRVNANSQLIHSLTRFLTTMANAMDDVRLAINNLNSMLLLVAHSLAFTQKTLHFTQNLQDSINSKHLNLGLIDNVDLEKAFSMVRKEAAQNNRYLTIEHPYQLHEVPASFQLQKNKLKATLAIPVFQTDTEPMEILKASPALLLTNNGHLLKFESNSVILRGRERMIVLSDAEFHHRCSTSKGTSGCTIGIIHHSQPSCEADLLKGLTARTSRRCQQQLKVLDPTQEAVIQTAQNEFDWYVPNASKVLIHCDRGTPDPAYKGLTQEARLQGLSKITLPGHCQAATKEVTASNIDAVAQIRIDTAEILSQKTFQKILDDIQLPAPGSWTNLSHTIHQLKEGLEDPSLKDLLQATENNLILPESVTAALPKDTYIILIASIVIFTVTTVCLCCLFQNYRRRPIHSGPPIDDNGSTLTHFQRTLIQMSKLRDRASDPAAPRLY